MGKGIGFSIKGLDETLATFGAMQEAALSEEFSQRVADAAEMVAQEARNNAPVATTQYTPPGHEPGTLRDFGIGKHVITHGVSGRSGKSGIVVTAAYIGFTQQGWYGIFPEFGTVSMSARPFMIPAFERMRSQVIDTVANGFYYTVMGKFL